MGGIVLYIRMHFHACRCQIFQQRPNVLFVGVLFI